MKSFTIVPTDGDGMGYFSLSEPDASGRTARESAADERRRPTHTHTPAPSRDRATAARGTLQNRRRRRRPDDLTMRMTSDIIAYCNCRSQQGREGRNGGQSAPGNHRVARVLPERSLERMFLPKGCAAASGSKAASGRSASGLAPSLPPRSLPPGKIHSNDLDVLNIGIAISDPKPVVLKRPN